MATVLSEILVGLYFRKFCEWLRICEILSVNFPEQLENGSRSCFHIGRFRNNRSLLSGLYFAAYEFGHLIVLSEDI